MKVVVPAGFCFYSISGWAPGIFNIFPNGFKRGPYVLTFFNRF